MTKKLSLLMIFLIAFMSFCSCGNAVESLEGTQPLIDTQTEEKTEPTDNAVGGYISYDFYKEQYYQLDLGFVDHFIGYDKFCDEYLVVFDSTEDCNIGAFCEYYGITRDQYVAYWENRRIEYNNDPISDVLRFDYVYQTELSYDAWFGDDYRYDRAFLKTADYVSYKGDTLSEANAEKLIARLETTKTIRPDKEKTIMTDRYYTIDFRLMEYVGADKYSEFEKEFKNTDEFNIVNFVSYFDISEKEYAEVYKDYFLKPYNPDYLYGTKEIQALYFEKQPLNK